MTNLWHLQACRHKFVTLSFVTLCLFAICAVVLAGCSTGGSEPEPGLSPAPSSTSPPSSGAPTAQRPQLAVSTVVDGLQIPWDIAFLPSGGMLYTERDRERLTQREVDGSSRVVLSKPDGMWHGVETGLESITLAHDFSTSHDFITCNGHRKKGVQDVRVVRWHLGKKSASFVRNLVTGLPSTSGRHGGCALEHDNNGALYVGTGDAADGTNPQNLDSGGGKVLRIDDTTGKGLKDNPFASSKNAMKRRVWSYGHRNVQGLALRDDGTVWSIEHGTDKNDEVNRSVKGGNFGWNPVPGYNESRPMTDHSLPGKQINAVWRSGKNTRATSGGTFLRADAWGTWKGGLAVASLKDESLHILLFTDAGKLTKDVNIKQMKGKFGRLRATVEGPDGSLYVTTSNGRDDKIIKITPSQ